MLGRKSFTRDEVDHAKASIDEQVAAYRPLVKAVAAKPGDTKVNAALDTFETLFFNNLTVALDRYFVHRLRMVTGKDGNPLNEVELLCDSLMNNDGILRGSNVVKLIPEQSGVKLHVGDPIRLTEDDFDRLSSAFFVELERKFL
ncbi:MAG TPA: hypothetical protein VIM10_00570 [Actinopolymorphaceae bacterium]